MYATQALLAQQADGLDPFIFKAPRSMVVNGSGLEVRAIERPSIQPSQIRNPSWPVQLIKDVPGLQTLMQFNTRQMEGCCSISYQYRTAEYHGLYRSESSGPAPCLS
jgi:hypothetical protein